MKVVLISRKSSYCHIWSNWRLNRVIFIGRFIRSIPEYICSSVSFQFTLHDMLFNLFFRIFFSLLASSVLNQHNAVIMYKWLKIKSSETPLIVHVRQNISEAIHFVSSSDRLILNPEQRCWLNILRVFRSPGLTVLSMKWCATPSELKWPHPFRRNKLQYYLSISPRYCSFIENAQQTIEYFVLLIFRKNRLFTVKITLIWVE